MKTALNLSICAVTAFSNKHVRKTYCHGVLPRCIAARMVTRTDGRSTFTDCLGVLLQLVALVAGTQVAAGRVHAFAVVQVAASVVD